MKCPKCGYNIKGKSVSYGTTCPSPSCDYRYVFSKSDQPPMTDGRFEAVVRKASGNDSRYYTFEELWAAYAKLLYDKRPGPILIGIILGILSVFFLIGPIWVLASNSGWAWLLLIIPVVFGIAWVSRLPRKLFKPPTREAFQAHLAKWTNAGRKLEKYIREPTLHRPPPNWTEADIYDYGAERILIVERDILVDWFVLNGWHTQNRTLVIAESGYPNYVTERASEMVRAHPELPILLLHDATTDAAEMERRIRSRARPVPLDNHPVTDLGLTTNDVSQLNRLSYLAPQHNQNQLPVDALGFNMLGPGLATAAVGGLALGALIAEAQARPSGSGSDSSSFG